MKFLALFLPLLLAPLLCSAGEPGDIALKAQRAWRDGDGDTILELAHPTLIDRIAQLQVKSMEKAEKTRTSVPWLKVPNDASTSERFRKLPKLEQARWFFIGLREILRDHPKITFTFSLAGEVIEGTRASVTVIEHQRATEGKIQDVRYPFVLERVGPRWAYVSGGSERLHVDTQLLLLGP